MRRKLSNVAEMVAEAKTLPRVSRSPIGRGPEGGSAAD